MLDIRHLLSVAWLASACAQSVHHSDEQAEPLPEMVTVSVSVTFPDEACAQNFVAELPLEFWGAYDESADPICDDRTWSAYGADGSCWQFAHVCGGSEVWDDPFFTEASPDGLGASVVCETTGCAAPRSPPWSYPTGD